MGLGGISIWQLAIILAIVIVLFGTKRLKNIGTDVGESIKGFRKSMNSEDDTPPPVHTNVLDAQAHVEPADVKR
ncbi:twin-arginine translocase TatA/TatE family subunit [Pseudomonas sp. R5(2019)]|uniref:twin-arginine translocase TatA/TatE family subunit n=1 Tax=Pseudomonas sp. R5(2019) TaxID=2697566 RepID=UPI001412BAE4|nr:twin-arginine translocase TatA/TatE family subunit [Pseudomonas sp. R5(2019)]